MKLDTVIQGGRVVTASETMRADVGIRGEKIVAVGRQLASAAAGVNLVNAEGCYVVPGGVDAHVHLDLPFGATVSADDYDSGTRAAACGGVTTVIDFATPYGKETLQQAVDNWHARAEGRACVDYSFHVCITNWPRHQMELRSMIDQGMPTFKQYMIYAKQGWQADDAAIFCALEALRDLGGMLLVHAESSGVLDLLIERCHRPAVMREYGARLHPLTRPNFIEAEAVERAIHWSRATGGRLFIVHMSTGEGADLVKRAQADGVPVLAETCAQYLTLDDRVFAGKDGHLFATCPQLKKPRDQKRLWEGLAGGEICSVSTDTCTFTRKQKSVWKGDWTRIPMGMPGLETMLPLVYTEGVLKRRLTVNQFVDKCCTTPARVMGLYPRKGALQVGSDADLVVFHPTDKRRVDWRKMQTNCDWSPFQGRELAGFAKHTFCRGRQIVRDYQFVGRNGHGQFIRRANPGLD